MDGDGWTLVYRRLDGACFELSGREGRLVIPDLPLASTEAEVVALGRRARVYQAADDPGATSAQVWGVGAVVSEPIRLEGADVLFLSDTKDGCRPVSLEEGARLVSSLRLLTVASGASATGLPASGREVGLPTATRDLGPFAPADDVLDAAVTGPSPEAVAEAVAARYGRDAGRVAADVLSRGSYEATALVTLLDLRDDSVRDERLRLTLTPVGDGWRPVEAGRQVRCQPGRGHADWGPGTCL